MSHNFPYKYNFDEKNLMDERRKSFQAYALGINPICICFLLENYETSILFLILNLSGLLDKVDNN